MHPIPWAIITITLLSVFVVAPLAANDAIYEKCKEHPRGPWCYEEAVEQINRPDLCENILTYWPKADGVHGWCYYQLGMKNKDCGLCSRIHKADLKQMCQRDVCQH